jgi:hypothetical protein
MHSALVVVFLYRVRENFATDASRFFFAHIRERLVADPVDRAVRVVIFAGDSHHHLAVLLVAGPFIP